MVPKVPALVGSEPAGLTPGFQPTMVPSSVANRKMAEVFGLPGVRSKAVLFGPKAVSKAVPVGVPLFPVGSPGVGMLTTSGPFGGGGCGWPWPLYRVDTPALLSETQKGLVGLAVRPQGLTRWG